MGRASHPHHTNHTNVTATNTYHARHHQRSKLNSVGSAFMEMVCNDTAHRPSSASDKRHGAFMTFVPTSHDNSLAVRHYRRSRSLSSSFSTGRGRWGSGESRTAGSKKQNKQDSISGRCRRERRGSRLKFYVAVVLLDGRLGRRSGTEQSRVKQRHSVNKANASQQLRLMSSDNE